MTTYKQLLKLNYDELMYSQFLHTCVLYNRTPFKVLVYASEKESTTLIMFSRTQSETITTRQMKFNKDSAKAIVQRILNDFNNIQIEVLNEDIGIDINV